MATYYVDPTKTITEINNSTFSPGDFILFARDGKWRDASLIPHNSGEPGNPITYGAYGSGKRPQLLGSNLISGVEIPTRSSCISSGNKSYITIQGLELAYPTHLGIDLHSPLSSYWIVDGVEVHHCGSFNAPTAAGISSRASHCQFINGFVYECGTHGININADAGAVVTDILVENMTCHNNYHADIQALDWGGGSISNIRFLRNYIFTTTAWRFPAVTSCCGFYVEGINPVDDVLIADNIVENHMGNGYAVGSGAKNINLFNNIAYKSNPHSTINSSGFHVYSDAISGIVLKNNIGVDWKDGCLKVQNKQKVALCDYNCWYHSGGGTNAYAIIDGIAYGQSDFNAYKTATGFDTNGKWEDPKIVAFEFQEEPMPVTKTIPFTLEIVAAPNFFPEMSPPSLKVVDGSVAVFSVSFTAEGGFTGPVSLAVIGLPTGAIGTFSKPSINLGETSVLSISTDAPLGIYPCSVEATANL